MIASASTVETALPTERSSCAPAVPVTTTWSSDDRAGLQGEIRVSCRRRCDGDRLPLDV